MKQFLNNKYSRTYFSIIDRAKNRIIEGYKETHHIVPRSIGGNDSPNNLVDLTAREHYVCHLLLPHMVNNTLHKSKLFHAMGMMVRGNAHGRIYSSWEYERARRDHARGNTLRQTGKQMNLSQEERTRRSDAMRTARQQRSYTPLSETVKANISKARKGQPAHNKGKPANKHHCPHCDKTISGDGNFSRWHGDNCKLNPNRLIDNRETLSKKLKGKPKPKYQCSKCDRMIGGKNNFERHQSSCLK